MVFSKRIALILPPLMAFMIVDDSVARELRPSYHGLEYQSSPPIGGKLPPEMKEFFGSSSSSSSKSSTVALPKAMSSNNTTTWWNGVGGEKGGDRWTHVLLVASLGCGVTGAALLAVSAVIYLVKYKRQKESSGRDNSKAIVVSK